jgi:RNA polymerase sigma-70 factor (ECF subfamily)
MPDLSTTEALQVILDRFLTGDAAAKRELIGRAYDRLLVVARKVLRSFSSVDESTAAVMNDAYSKLDKALTDVKPPTVRAFFGLASLQVRRVLLDMVRAEKRGPDVHRLGGGGGDDTADYGHDKSDTGNAGGNEGQGADIVAAVDRLPDDEREVVDLLFWMGLTQPEAGAVLGVHEDTVKRRWATARIKLRGVLKDYGPLS